MGINNLGQQAYKDPAGGSPSSIGPQINTHSYIKRALIEKQKEIFFGPMADVRGMPKHMGKEIKQFLYVPLLDDANINDQGIDAAGVVGNGTVGKMIATATAVPPNASGQALQNPGPYVTEYFTAENKVTATAVTAANAALLKFVKAKGFADIAAAKAANWTIVEATAATAVPYGGNLYGSSKDVGTIVGKMPALTEYGGTVNRVGFTRIELTGGIEKYGFYEKYTQESLDFDTDAELEMHIHREMIFGASEINEDLLQIDLLNAAGVIYYAGSALKDADLSGETGAVTEVTYGDLSRLSVELDNNRCPKQTKIISGSRMIDTRVIRGGRPMYIGSELQQTIEQMEDYFHNQAFISTAHYAAAATIMNGEIGTVGQFRIIVVPEMMYWAGKGAAVTKNGGYRETGGKYNIYPMLVIGDSSFTTIGFQTSGGKSKFTIKHSKPGSPESYAGDPYGETGFMSIKWYYGFMALRPERIALIKTVAKH